MPLLPFVLFSRLDFLNLLLLLLLLLGKDRTDAIGDAKWANDVNSRTTLERALQSDATFIVGDVALGYVQGDQWQSPEVILANRMSPPDISLDQWLDRIARQSGAYPIKTLVLNFKDSEAIQPSLQILQRKKPAFSVWLQADILSISGSTEGQVRHLDADWFLGITSKMASSDTTLVLSWATGTTRPHNQRRIHHSYSWSDVTSMVNLLSCHNLALPVAFSLRASYALRSIRQITWLSKVVPQSRLIIKSSHGDRIDVNSLVDLQQSLPQDRVFYDLQDSPRLEEQFGQHKDRWPQVENQNLFHDGNWLMYPPTQPECQASAYVTSDVLVMTYPTPEGQLIVLRTSYRAPVTVSATLLPYEILNYQHYNTYVSNRFSVLVLESESFPPTLEPSSVSYLAESSAQVTFETWGMQPSTSACNVSFIFDPSSLQMDPCRTCTGCPSLCSSGVPTGLRSGCSQGAGRAIRPGSPVRIAFLFSGWRGFVLTDVTVFGEPLRDSQSLTSRGLANPLRETGVFYLLLYLLLEI